RNRRVLPGDLAGAGVVDVEVAGIDDVLLPLPLVVGGKLETAARGIEVADHGELFGDRRDVSVEADILALGFNAAANRERGQDHGTVGHAVDELPEWIGDAAHVA